MEEVDHAQCRGQVLSSHQVWRHHGDQRHICAIEVTIEDSEGHEEREGPKQRHEEAAETLHRHGEDVTSQTVRLQTPERRTEKTCFYFKQEEIKTDFNHPEKKQEGGSLLTHQCIPPVRQPAEGDVPHDVDDSQDGHEEGSLLVAEPGSQTVGHQVDEGEAAAAGQQQEGHSQAQEVRQQQEMVLLAGQEAGAEAPPPQQLRGWVSRQKRQGQRRRLAWWKEAVLWFFGLFNCELSVLWWHVTWDRLYWSQTHWISIYYISVVPILEEVSLWCHF